MARSLGAISLFFVWEWGRWSKEREPKELDSGGPDYCGGHRREEMRTRAAEIG